MTDKAWWCEPMANGLLIQSQIVGDVKDLKSKIQDIKIINTVPFGRLLIIDGHTQSSQLDEHIYHESLVHPVMLAHDNPKRVFIGGGGELATAREVLKHSSVEKLIMVDIDEQVVNFARENLLDEWNIDWVEKDSRFELVIQDAKKYLEDYKGDNFDIIILDIVDPIAAGPGVELYTKDFYDTVKLRLNKDGLFVTQAGPCGMVTHKECFTVIHNTMEKTFDNVSPYALHMPCFMELWGVIIAWNGDRYKNIASVEPDEVDDKIKKRISKTLKYYDGITHRGIMNIPKFLRESIAKEERIIDSDFIREISK